MTRLARLGERCGGGQVQSGGLVSIADELDLRTKSDFLKAETANGEKADFHAFRHSFITMLASSGVHPKVAQQLARHSTITLTMDRYSHARLVDLNAAVEILPSLAPLSKLAHATPLTGTTGETRLEVDPTGPATGPKLAPASDKTGLALMTADETPVVVHPTAETNKPLKNRGLMSSDDNCERLRKLRPVGVEPTTYGLEIRCSIQLSYGRLLLYCNGSRRILQASQMAVSCWFHFHWRNQPRFACAGIDGTNNLPTALFRPAAMLT